MDFFRFNGQGAFFYARVRAYIVLALLSALAGSLLASDSSSAADQTKAKIKSLHQAAASRQPGAREMLGERLQRDADPKIRAAAVDGLAHLQGTDSALHGALKDKDALVRLEAVQALGKRGDKPARLALEDRLLKDGNEGVRMAAAFWLGQIKDGRSAGVLGQALTRDSDPNVRAQAARSLQWLGKAGRQEVKRGQNDSDIRVKRIANE